MNTPQSIAIWMLEELEREKNLFQEVVVYDIETKFGKEFTYINDNGNLAINKSVLQEFRNLTEKKVVWERGGRFWRFREEYDDPNKRQAE